MQLKWKREKKMAGHSICTKDDGKLKETEKRLEQRLALKKESVSYDRLIDDIRLHGLTLYESFNRHDYYNPRGEQGRVHYKVEGKQYDIILKSLKKESERLKAEYEDFINASYIA